jgi:hypothetical protein
MSATATSSAWDELTPVQSDAVHATAAAHDLDPEQLAAELLPLLRARRKDAPPVQTPPQQPVARSSADTNPPTKIAPAQTQRWTPSSPSNQAPSFRQGAVGSTG